MALGFEPISGIPSPENPVIAAGPARLRATILLPLCLVAIGLAVRLALAHSTFLNPDEAWHYLLSVQPSFRLAYQASLTTAHPPLLILLLYWWRSLGDSELVLRIPSVVAGTVFCWVTFLWVEKVANRKAALFTLALLLLSPSLISISAEIRQYSLLLSFCAFSLYFLECALAQSSVRMLLFSFLAVYLALLAHYSALIFLLTLGVYALLRLREIVGAGLTVAWVAGELGAVGLTAFLVISHLSMLRKNGLSQQIANTWLRSSMFRPDENPADTFALKATVRLFRYFFSHGTIGVLGLLLFVGGIALLVLGKEAPGHFHKPSSPHLAMLLVVPFLINLGTGLAGLYPYGGTRHDILLVGFAMTGISISLARLKIASTWLNPLALAVALTICNLFPFPTPPYISPRDQKKELMTEAMNYLGQGTPMSTVVTDYQGGLLLSYYLCSKSAVDLAAMSQAFVRSQCRDYQVLTPPQAFFIFNPETLPGVMRNFQRRYNLSQDTPVWLFQAGWIDSSDNVCHELGRCGRNFGKNILLCEINGAAVPTIDYVAAPAAKLTDCRRCHLSPHFLFEL